MALTLPEGCTLSRDSWDAINACSWPGDPTVLPTEAGGRWLLGPLPRGAWREEPGGRPGAPAPPPRTQELPSPDRHLAHSILRKTVEKGRGRGQGRSREKPGGWGVRIQDREGRGESRESVLRMTANGEKWGVSATPTSDEAGGWTQKRENALLPQ